MSMVAIDIFSTHTASDLHKTQGHKRQRSCSFEALTPATAYEDGENFEHEESSKKRKSTSTTAEQQKTTFTCNLRVTKEAVCNINLTLLNNNFDQASLAALCSATSQQIKVADFCSKSLVSAYKQNQTQQYTVPALELTGADHASQVVLSYLRGMICRKDEAACCPIDNSPYMILLFESEVFKAAASNNSGQEENTDDIDSFFAAFEQHSQDSIVLNNSNLHAIIVPKFTIVFDLDETLIKTRMPKDAQDVCIHPNEVEFTVYNTRLITAVRPGTDLVLKWASNVFNVQIFTNAVYDYAKAICKILDPTRSTILAHVNEQDENSWRSLIKSRTDFDTAAHLPNSLRIKDLAKFSICCYSSVVLDDDVGVWKQQDNVLPFVHIMSNNKAPHEFLHKMRNETWQRIAELKQLHIQQQVQQEEKCSNSSAE